MSVIGLQLQWKRSSVAYLELEDNVHYQAGEKVEDNENRPVFFESSEWKGGIY
jgi:hypothetical protein